MLKNAIYIVLFFVSFTLADTLSLVLPDSLNKLIENTTSLTMMRQYDNALNSAKALRKKNESIGCIIESIVRVSIYDDLGDTTSLLKAGNELEKCNANGLWEALLKFELGYVQSETGHSIKGAMKTRSAAKVFENSNEQEARAFYAIYAYYVDQSFSWLPFKSDNRDEYLAVLDSASFNSNRFWPLFLTPLIWMYYDKEDFNKGLTLAERGLKNAPNHPVFFQIKADMLYRLKRFDEAAKIYEQSAKDYLAQSGKSIRYWCAVLNLIRIYHDKNDTKSAQLWRNKLNDPSYKALEKWMPESLTSDLKKRKLF